MSAMKRVFAPPRPWHLLFAPALPLLGLFASNAAMSSPGVIVVPLAAGILFTVMLWLLILPVAGDAHRAAFAASIFVLAVMSHGALRGVPGVPWSIPLFYAVVAIVCGRLVRTAAPAAAATSFLNKAFALAALFLALPMWWSGSAHAASTLEPFRVDARGTTERPDVYVLVLDGYAREDVLRDQYGFRSSLASELRGFGFDVVAGAMANYAQTSLSLASALNADYLPQLGFPANRETVRRHAAAAVLRENRFFKAFKAAGYHVRAYGSEYTIVRPGPADERPAPRLTFNEFHQAALESTVFPAAARSLGFDRGGLSGFLHGRHLQWTLDRLQADEPDDSRPSLVFAHLIAPHPPFVFDNAGAPRRTAVPMLLYDGPHWKKIARSTGERYASGYLDMVGFLDRRLPGIVAEILGRQGRPRILLIHSDHGPGDRLDWDDAARTDMRERMGILLAVRFPDGEATDLGPRATPVNAYRAVLNRALGTRLPPLEDRAFFSTWNQPFAYIEVTDRVNCRHCG